MNDRVENSKTTQSSNQIKTTNASETEEVEASRNDDVVEKSTASNEDKRYKFVNMMNDRVQQNQVKLPQAKSLQEAIESSSNRVNENSEVIKTKQAELDNSRRELQKKEYRQKHFYRDPSLHNIRQNALKKIKKLGSNPNNFMNRAFSTEEERKKYTEDMAKIESERDAAIEQKRNEYQDDLNKTKWTIGQKKKEISSLKEKNSSEQERLENLQQLVIVREELAKNYDKQNEVNQELADPRYETAPDQDTKDEIQFYNNVRRSTANNINSLTNKENEILSKLGKDFLNEEKPDVNSQTIPTSTQTSNAINLDKSTSLEEAIEISSDRVNGFNETIQKKPDNSRALIAVSSQVDPLNLQSSQPSKTPDNSRALVAVSKPENKLNLEDLKTITVPIDRSYRRFSQPSAKPEHAVDFQSSQPRNKPGIRDALNSMPTMTEKTRIGDGTRSGENLATQFSTQLLPQRKKYSEKEQNTFLDIMDPSVSHVDPNYKRSMKQEQSEMTSYNDYTENGSTSMYSSANKPYNDFVNMMDERVQQNPVNLSVPQSLQKAIEITQNDIVQGEILLDESRKSLTEINQQIDLNKNLWKKEKELQWKKYMKRVEELKKNNQNIPASETHKLNDENVRALQNVENKYKTIIEKLNQDKSKSELNLSHAQKTLTDRNARLNSLNEFQNQKMRTKTVDSPVLEEEKPVDSPVLEAKKTLSEYENEYNVWRWNAIEDATRKEQEIKNSWMTFNKNEKIKKLWKDTYAEDDKKKNELEEIRNQFPRS